jgi:hypothetical protein
MNRTTSWEHTISTNGGGIIPSIGWPSGLSGSAIGSILNLWQRPRRKKFSRQPDWDPQHHTGDVFARSLYFKDPNGIVLEFCAWTATFGPADVVHTPKTAADLITEQEPVTV